MLFIIMVVQLKVVFTYMTNILSYFYCKLLDKINGRRLCPIFIFLQIGNYVHIANGLSRFD